MQCSLTKREGDVLLLLAQRKTLAQISDDWEAALDDYFAEHNEIRLDGDAERSTDPAKAQYVDPARYYTILAETCTSVAMQCSLTKREGEVLLLLNADGDFRIEADVNLDATQEEGEVIFKNYRVGFVEDLAE